ncbi:FAD-binding oxidoreductase [Parasphingorhabdus cellanae]|uniref:D-amino-acid oxidase n=1 Tax=Parasphingorhabdus cellanae TaxID=2806553 RepID=A0ABX7T4N8_9SPHN|nr:FAD-dependent oxidoreductase [Parasphingorhabdus cellanae]QTD56556.1 FAD-binding oxidoreductase [Parasphingorhabdus cellanae]
MRRQALGDQQIVHNYGHGGGGITLSWGSSRLAVDLGLPGHRGPVAVLGAGIMGLTTARLLQEAGQAVTIYTSKLPPFTTSNIAGGQWYPSNVFRHSALTPEFQQQFIAAAEYSYQRYQLLVGERYGIRWMPNYELSSSPINMGRTSRMIASMLPDRRTLSPEENQFASAHVGVWQAMFIEPARFLRELQRDILIADGQIKVRHFANRAQISELRETLIFNCTGLGTGQLFDDEELIPLRGQLSILLPQPEIDYAYTTSNGLYMFPRSDGIVLGGTSDAGNADLTPSSQTTRYLVRGHNAIADAMRCG